ncbi:hypothetical protein ABIB90_002547 [Bradyrhizobium sp. JR4.1]
MSRLHNEFFGLYPDFSSTTCAVRSLAGLSGPFTCEVDAGL